MSRETTDASMSAGTNPIWVPGDVLKPSSQVTSSALFAVRLSLVSRPGRGRFPKASRSTTSGIASNL